jgi:acyl-CoA synthetase (AMP-forming)/AMP-acid ligase II/acyl carrier protein
VEEFALASSDRFSFLSGLSHDPALRDIFTPLWAGGTLCVPNPEEFGSPGYLSRWMKREEITIAHVTPAMMQLLTEVVSEVALSPRSNVAASSVRYAFFGGDNLTKRDVSRFQNLFPSATCVNFYGATETPQAMGHFVIPQPREKGYGDEITTENIPLGRGIEGVQLLVLNDAEQLAGSGEVGEIHVRTPYLAKGYLGNNALTQQRFVANPFNKIAGDRLYKTGDRGRYLPDGTLEFIGRADHQVKIRGFRIEPGEIETVLSQHPAVRETVVVARGEVENPKSETCGERVRSVGNPKSPDPSTPLRAGKRLVAYVVSRQRQAPAANDLRDFVKKKLPEYMVPSAFVFLDALPLTPNGKVDRRTLPAPDRWLALEEGYATPRTPVEERLAKIWTEVLKVERVGIHDNFFRLGGHSLKATQLMSRLREAFQVEVPLRKLFEIPTVAELAESIEAMRFMAERPQQADSIAGPGRERGEI